MAIQNILKLGIGYEYLPSGNPVSLYIGQNSLYILTYGKIQTWSRSNSALRACLPLRIQTRFLKKKWSKLPKLTELT
jgi:hypothetical protein